MEIRRGDAEERTSRVRRVFERVTGGGVLKPRKAKFFFKRWLEFEEGLGGGKGVEKVKALAGEYVKGQKGVKKDG